MKQQAWLANILLTVSIGILSYSFFYSLNVQDEYKVFTGFLEAFDPTTTNNQISKIKSELSNIENSQAISSIMDSASHESDLLYKTLLLQSSFAERQISKLILVIGGLAVLLLGLSIALYNVRKKF